MEQNTVADALSQLPPDTFSKDLPPHAIWSSGVNTTMSISTDAAILEAIKCGYTEDPFCECLGKTNTPGATFMNGLWYVRDRLVIPRVGDLCENSFHLTHDTLGHFGADKVYTALWDAYYWPNM